MFQVVQGNMQGYVYGVLNGLLDKKNYVNWRTEGGRL